MNTITDNTSQNNSTQIVEYAGFWIRFGAAFLDDVVFLPISIFNFYNLLHLKSIELYIIAILLQMIYKPLMEYKYGATLGKMWLHLKVVNENFEGITFNQSLMRYIPWFINNLLTIFAVNILFNDPDFFDTRSLMDLMQLQAHQTQHPLNSLGTLFFITSCLFVGFTLKKQGLHDFMAKTYVIQE